MARAVPAGGAEAACPSRPVPASQARNNVAWEERRNPRQVARNTDGCCTLGVSGVGDTFAAQRPQRLSILRAAMKADCGISTSPICRMRFLPFFCFSRSFFLRLDVAAVALRQHVLAHRADRLARDHAAADRGLDGDLEELAGIRSFSRSQSWRPRLSAAFLCTIMLSASTGSAFTRMASFTSSLSS